MTRTPKFVRKWLGEPLLSLILVLCLVIGISAFILITVYLSYQLSWDSHLPDLENTYELKTTMKLDVTYPSWHTSVELAKALKGRLPQIEDCYAMSPLDINFLFTHNDDPVDMRLVVLVSENALKRLGMKLIYGDIETCLKDPKALLVSRSMALRVFGDRDPLGETIHLNTDNRKLVRFVITGVFEDFPENQHVQSDFFFLSDHLNVVGEESTQVCNPQEFRNGGTIYFVLKDGTDPAIVEQEAQKIYQEVKDSIPDNDPDTQYIFTMVPLRDVHYRTEWPGVFETFDRKKLMKYGVLALAILLVVISNTIILLMVRIMDRKREIDIRRSFGASESDIVWQFIGEHTVLYLFVLILSIGIVWLILPYIRQWVHGLPQQIAINPSFWFHTAIGLVVGGLVTVIYPAGYALLLRNRSKRNHWKLIMTIQLSLSLLLLTSAVLLHRQLRHIERLDPGMDAANVHSFYYISCEDEYREILLEETRNVPGVESLCFSDFMPTKALHESYLHIDGEASSGDYLRCQIGISTPGLFEVYKVPLAKGRVLDSPESNGLIVNEAFMRRYAHHGIGLGTPMQIGREGMSSFFFDGVIIGIVKDVWWEDVRKPVRPMVYCNGHIYGGYFHYRIRPEMEDTTLKQLQEIMYRLAQKYRVREVTCDTQYEIEHNYDSEWAFLQVVNFSTIIGMFFTFVGIYGLTAYTLKKQLRNLAIRQVYGATPWDTLKLLLRDYLILLGIALGISIPVSHYLLTKWLHNFSYRVSLGSVDYGLSLAATSLIVLFAVVIHWQKLQRIRLIEFLRTE